MGEIEGSGIGTAATPAAEYSAAGARGPVGIHCRRVKALSLWQPHAAAIALGLKLWETRDWPTRYRGPLAIHAAKRPWNDGGEWHCLAGAALGVHCVKLVRDRFPDIEHEHLGRAARALRDRVMALGAVICIVDLVDCVPTSDLRGKIGAAEFWGDFGDGETGAGRFAFKLENLRLLQKPLPWRGMQGFFEVDLGGDEVALPQPPQLDLFAEMPL